MTGSVVAPAQRLHLTCTRRGTRCHGKEVWVHPWELARLAHARREDVRTLRDRAVPRDEMLIVNPVIMSR